MSTEPMSGERLKEIAALAQRSITQQISWNEADKNAQNVIDLSVEVARLRAENDALKHVAKCLAESDDDNDKLEAENAALKAELRNTQMHLRTAQERLAERTAELEAARADSALSIAAACVSIEALELIWPTIPIDDARAETPGE